MVSWFKNHQGFFLFLTITYINFVPDIAVGAPFEGEDGSGAVYIYRGSYNGINPNYKQVPYEMIARVTMYPSFSFKILKNHARMASKSDNLYVI